MEARCGLTPSPKHACGTERRQTRHLPRNLGAADRQRTLMLMVMNFFQAIGFFGFGNWLPALLPGQGASITIACCTPSLSPSPIRWAACSAPASCIALKTSGRLSSALMTVIFGTLFALQNNPILLVICGFMITWSNAWLTISYHAYQAEVF